jgi:hypothetical protein
MQKVDFKLNEKVNELLKEHRQTFGWLASEVGMSHEGLRNALIKQSVKIQVLDKIASLLEEDITYFFTDPEGMNNINQIEGNRNLTVQGKKNKTDNQSEAGKKSEAEYTLVAHEVSNLRQQLELARQRIGALEKEIELKDEIINLLKQQR